MVFVKNGAFRTNRHTGLAIDAAGWIDKHHQASFSKAICWANRNALSMFASPARSGYDMSHFVNLALKPSHDSLYACPRRLTAVRNPKSSSFSHHRDSNLEQYSYQPPKIFWENRFLRKNPKIKGARCPVSDGQPTESTIFGRFVLRILVGPVC